MEAAAQSRKERLQALKRRKLAVESGEAGDPARHAIAGAAGEDEENEDPDKMSTVQLVRSFRNYDKATGQAKRAQPKALEDTIEKEVEGVQEAVLAEDALKREEELDLTNIAPRKPNWDLKRDLERRLAKLERRDKEARLILIRQRLQAATANGGEATEGKLTALQAEVAMAAVGDEGEDLTAGRSDDEDQEDEDE